eukprot:3172295-Amphidinium_carterae.2
MPQRLCHYGCLTGQGGSTSPSYCMSRQSRDFSHVAERGCGAQASSSMMCFSSVGVYTGLLFRPHCAW